MPAASFSTGRIRVTAESFDRGRFVLLTVSEPYHATRTTAMLFISIDTGCFPQGVLDKAVGAEVARGWCDLAERALIAFGGNPLPQATIVGGSGGGGGVGSGGSGWWGGLEPLTPCEKSMASVSREEGEGEKDFGIFTLCRF